MPMFIPLTMSVPFATFFRLAKSRVMVAGRRADRGATAVEYGLMVALIAIVILVAVSLLGQQLSGVFTSAADTV